MPDTSPPDSPLRAAAGDAGATAAEAFSLLANETRLAILLALWEAHDTEAPDEVVPFSELYRAVDYDNPGNFSYHLDKLVGHYVRKVEGGYQLRRAGEKIVRAVIGGAGIDAPTLDPVEIDMPCVLCGAPTAVSYEDESLYQTCTACEGFFALDETQPEGLLNEIGIDPAGLEDRTPDELFAAAWLQSLRHLWGMVEGVCPSCSGLVAGELGVCTDHTDDGICETCGRGAPSWVEFKCTVCKDIHTTLPNLLVMYHPAVVSFYHERGVRVQWQLSEFGTLRAFLERSMDHRTETISTDPPRVRVIIAADGDELALTLDEALDIVDLDR